MNWLDTETKTILQKASEPKPAPAKAGEFALILLRKGAHWERLVRAIGNINNCTAAEADRLARLPEPVTINHGLTEAEALYGQFELISCDSISIFLRSEVFAGQEQDYLRSLYAKVLASSEFAQVVIRAIEIPTTESGEKFAEQFFGGSVPVPEKNAQPPDLLVPFKKARIMKHWAARIGARIECDAVKDHPQEL